jgi:hypothetical protein
MDLYIDAEVRLNSDDGHGTRYEGNDDSKLAEAYPFTCWNWMNQGVTGFVEFVYRPVF